MKTLLISIATDSQTRHLKDLVDDFTIYRQSNNDIVLLPIYKDGDFLNIKTNFANQLGKSLTLKPDDIGNVWWIDPNFRIGSKIVLPEVKAGEVYATSFLHKRQNVRIAPALKFENYESLLENNQHFQYTDIIGFHSLKEAKDFCKSWNKAFNAVIDPLDTLNDKRSEQPSYWKTISTLKKTTRDLTKTKIDRISQPVPGLFNSVFGNKKIPKNFFTSPENNKVEIAISNNLRSLTKRELVDRLIERDLAEGFVTILESLPLAEKLRYDASPTISPEYPYIAENLVAICTALGITEQAFKDIFR